MTLASGARLGPYEITVQIGVREMEQMYRIRPAGNMSDT